MCFKSWMFAVWLVFLTILDQSPVDLSFHFPWEISWGKWTVRATYHTGGTPVPRPYPNLQTSSVSSAQSLLPSLQPDGSSSLSIPYTNTLDFSMNAAMSWRSSRLQKIPGYSCLPLASTLTHVQRPVTTENTLPNGLAKAMTSVCPPPLFGVVYLQLNFASCAIWKSKAYFWEVT